MRIHVFSDVHAEINRGVRVAPVKDADLAVVAGDVSNSARDCVDWILENTDGDIPCVFVAGNHEFYGNEFPTELSKLRELAGRHDRLHFLENDVAFIGGVRFVGATLWTDYALLGDPATGMIAARNAMNDHMRIRCPDGPFLPKEARETHLLSRAFIRNALARPHEGKTVVVTHHCPHPRSVHPKYGTAPLNAAFASDLSDLIADGSPDLWIHGHTHSSFDYSLGDTRVLCNPMGYGAENREFDPELVVEL